jgi:hypothetical protein
MDALTPTRRVAFTSLSTAQSIGSIFLQLGPASFWSRYRLDVADKQAVENLNSPGKGMSATIAMVRSYFLDFKPL